MEFPAAALGASSPKLFDNAMALSSVTRGLLPSLLLLLLYKNGRGERYRARASLWVP